MHQPSYKQPDDTPDVIEREVDVPALCIDQFCDLVDELNVLQMEPGATFTADDTKWRRVALKISPASWRRVPTQPTDHDTPRIHPEHLL